MSRHAAPFDYLSGDEQSPRPGWCWQRLWMADSNEGRQVCFCCQVPVFLVRRAAPPLFSCATAESNSVPEDLCPQGSS